MFVARYLDGKVWPEKDEFAVRLLLSLIHHVTGVRLKAFFATAPETENGDRDGGLRCGITATVTIQRNCPLEQSTEPVTVGACELQSAPLSDRRHALMNVACFCPQAWNSIWNITDVWLAAPWQAAVLGAGECSALTGCPRARRPDQRALCGMFERHDGFLHCVRIRGIRCAAASCSGPLHLWHADLCDVQSGWRCGTCFRAQYALAEQAHPQVWHAAAPFFRPARGSRMPLCFSPGHPHQDPFSPTIEARGRCRCGLAGRPAAGRWAALEVLNLNLT